MAENNEKKTSWFEGLKAEFKKVIWPDGRKIGRQTLAVMLTSIVLGLIIVLVDMLVQSGIELLIR